MRLFSNPNRPKHRLALEQLETRSLLCATGPFDFEITAPTEGETIYTSTPIVEWSMSDGALNYSIEISTDPGGQNVIQSGGASGSQLQVLMGALDSGTYYASITATNINVPGNLLDACNSGLEFTIDTENAAALEHTVFITNNLYNVDPLAEPNPSGDEFGGFSSADFQITKSAAFAGMLPNWNSTDRIWTALLSTSEESARFRQTIRGPVKNTQGELLANDMADFWDGTLATGIKYDNFGLQASPGTPFWSGSTAFGGLSDNCADWQEIVSFISRLGDSHATLNWFDRSTSNCGTSHALSGISPPLRTWTIDCDLNDDGDCDVEDLNGLLRESDFSAAQPTHDHWPFDLNADLSVDQADIDYWLATAATFNGLASPYKRGDANLDGVVDGQDFIAWNASKFAATNRWDDGDFNGDGIVDGQDFILWNGNKFTSSDTSPRDSAQALVAFPRQLEAEEHKQARPTMLDLVFADYSDSQSSDRRFADSSCRVALSQIG